MLGKFVLGEAWIEVVGQLCKVLINKGETRSQLPLLYLKGKNIIQHKKRYMGIFLVDLALRKWIFASYFLAEK